MISKNSNNNKIFGNPFAKMYVNKIKNSNSANWILKYKKSCWNGFFKKSSANGFAFAENRVIMKNY